jgi:hypothetical protein
MVAENRICRPLSAATESPAPAQTAAELLHDLGVILRRRMRHATGTDRVSLLLQSHRWESKLALGFMKLRPSVQLRAMIENWPLDRIQEVVHAQPRETRRSRTGYQSRLGSHQGAEPGNKRGSLRQPSFLICLAACAFAIVLAAEMSGGLR